MRRPLIQRRVSRPGKAITARLALVMLGLVLTGHSALAAPSPDGTDVQQLRADAAARAGVDRSLNRGVAEFVAEGAGAEDSAGFTFTALLPGYYNSNAEQLSSDGTESLEANPELRLGWQRQLADAIMISALIDANSDRYPSASDANADAAYGRLRVQRITGKDDQEFQPFLEYSPRLIFAPFFGHNSSTSHDFRAGTDKVFNFDGGWHCVPHAADTSGKTVWSLSIEADLLRRQTNSGSSSTRVEIDPNLTWYGSDSWNMSIELDVVPTWYDTSTSGSRYLTSTTAIFTFEYAPTTWVSTNKKRTFKVDFQIVYARADSADNTLTFKQWSLGPMLKGAISF